MTHRRQRLYAAGAEYIALKQSAIRHVLFREGIMKHITALFAILCTAALLYGNEGNMDITITLGDRTYGASLYDNSAAAAFYSMLPMTLDMSELNGNEKYFYLDSRLPATAGSVPGAIHTGDLMLYGADCIVLFYKSFSTPYLYTPLGRITDAADLEKSLGRGSVRIVFDKAE